MKNKRLIANIKLYLLDDLIRYEYHVHISRKSVQFRVIYRRPPKALKPSDLREGVKNPRPGNFPGGGGGVPPFPLTFREILVRCGPGGEDGYPP